MTLAPGARLGPFEIIAPLGAGGMGEVYRARDTRLHRTVAIKLLPAELAYAPGRRLERFRHEARVVASITHPNICALYDVGEDGPSIFLVMEYVDGAPLAQRLEDGPLPLAAALRTAIGIADALDHAHRNGVVHRDLKPGNVMLARDGVKLLDFGLAKLTESDGQELVAPTSSIRLTDVGAIMGTVPYMAPEQIEGREVDARTDIFAFGVVLYEMIGGRRPFAGDSRASLMAAIVDADPPALTSLQPHTPASLERLVRRCLAKDPEDRWQTARDLAAELRWIAEGGSGVTAAAAGGNRRRHRAALIAGLVGAALTAAVGAATLLSLWPTPAVPRYRPVTYRKGVVSSARFTPDGRSFVYSATWEGQPYAAFLGRPESPDARDLQLPDARVLSISRAGDMAVVFGPQNIQRTFGVRTLARIPMAGGARRDLLTGVVDADWIPGTDTLAVIRDPGNGRPWTVEFPLGTPVHEARAAWSLRVSPDGSRVAFFEGPLLFDSRPEAMVTIVDKVGRKTTVARGVSGYGLAWPPSQDEVWFTATRPGQHAPQVLASSLAGVERTVHHAPDWLVLHDIAADGRVLMSRNTIRMTMMCKPPAEAQERDLTWQLGSFAQALSRDGQMVIFTEPLNVNPGFDTPLFRRRMDGSPAVQIGEGRSGALSPDGRWVLTRSGDHHVLLPTGADVMVTLPKGNLAGRGEGTWFDSKRIVFTGGTGDNIPRGYMQDIPDGVPRPITPDRVLLAGPAAVRDGHSVLGRVGPTWALFPIQGGEARPVPGLTPRDLPLQWSADGRYVYTVGNINAVAARPPAIDVFRLEVATGTRSLWRTLGPSDPVGVEDMRPTISITPDAQSYCYSYMRRLGDLFVVDGLE